MEPEEFCQKWINKPKPEERGYYASCVRELARITTLSKRTIESWGPNFHNRPNYILAILDKEHKLRIVEKELKKLKKIVQNLEDVTNTE